MSSIKILIEKKYKIVVTLFFITYLFIGMISFKDYGISWDENNARKRGEYSVGYVVDGDQALVTFRRKYHGPAFEMFLYLIERSLNLTKNIRLVYLMRHLVTFLLFFTGVWFFYLLCKRRFQSWKMGLLGSLFLVLSPRIFAHSFYNSKDSAFLAFFIISIYTMLRYLDKKTLINAFFHALTCALLIDIRVGGIMVPFFTTIFLGIDLSATTIKESEGKKIIRSFFSYIILLVLFVIIFWPALWPNPLYHFKMAVSSMSQYPWRGKVLYLGKFITSPNLPWHYIPVWIIISTPLLYSACFFIGSFAVVRSIFKNPKQFFFHKREDLICMMWFFLPLVAVIILNSVLYDAWRHMFFIYPAFLMLALVGLRSVLQYFKTNFKGLSYRIINTVFVIIVVFNLINIARFMIRYHPFQNVYFNSLAGKNMKEIKHNFELDYWGLSYRQALEYILKNDTDDTIKIYVANAPGKYNANILSSDNRSKLVFVENPDQAKYFLSNYRWHRGGYPYQQEYYSIKVDGAKIMVVYKME
jgi:hypothetical protein